MLLFDFVNYIGKFHPVFVHLPIGFLILAAVFDVLSYFQKYTDIKSLVKFILLIGGISAVLACILGWMLASNGKFDSEILENHKYTGIITAVFSLVLYLLKSNFFQNILKLSPKIQSGLLLALMLLLAFTGHQGGNLTHGADFLSISKASKKTAISDSSLNTLITSDTTEIKEIINPNIPQIADQKAIEAAIKGGFNIRLMHKKPDMLDISFLDKKSIPNLELLKPLTLHIIWLNLKDLNLDNTIGKDISEMKNLEKLRLEKNNINDGIVKDLISLENLNSINLNETQISNIGLSELMQLKKLKTIYVWKTAVLPSKLKINSADSLSTKIVF